MMTIIKLKLIFRQKVMIWLMSYTDDVGTDGGGNECLRVVKCHGVRLQGFVDAPTHISQIQMLHRGPLHLSSYLSISTTHTQHHLSESKTITTSTSTIMQNSKKKKEKKMNKSRNEK